MTVQEKMRMFIAPANDGGLGADFECWKADPELTRLERQSPASMDWKGGSLKAIQAGDTPLMPVKLPEILQRMIKGCWKGASVSRGAAGPGRITLGGTVVYSDKSSGNFRFGGRQFTYEDRSQGDPAEQRRVAAMQRAGKHVPQVQPLISQEAKMNPFKDIPHLQGIANDWKTMNELPRVNAYTFRGDTRAPGVLANAGGFNPPNTRTDSYYVENVVKPAFTSYMKRRYGQAVSDAEFTTAYSQAAPAGSEERRVVNNYFVWRVMVENEAFHLGRMLADEALKGYISTTRAVCVARAFAKENGWVFLTRVRGGFLVPDRGTTVWTSIFGEQEIALPGTLKWKDVFGFRQVDAARKFIGPIYFRKAFEAHRIAFAQAYDLLSGKAQ
jgi:hypothetical protein